MILYQEASYSTPKPCPYLSGITSTQVYFCADKLDEFEIDLLFATGWRKFGLLFFRPVCTSCRKCIPVRIPVGDVVFSKSQRRVMRKNRNTVVRFGRLKCSDELFSIYKEHSNVRFNKDVTFEEFKDNLCNSACPSLLSQYYVDDILVGAGFLDRSSEALSSVYFIFKQSAESLSLGNYSILRELQYVREIGLRYYYLGYFIKGCTTMEYKNHFFPCEHFNWESGHWVNVPEKL